jgi:hypothetical protein
MVGLIHRCSECVIEHLNVGARGVEASTIRKASVSCTIVVNDEVIQILKYVMYNNE